MSEQLRCLNCGHVWRSRGGDPDDLQCPKCRKRRAIMNSIFDRTVTEVVRILRNFGRNDPLEELNQAYYHADVVLRASIHDPVLSGKALAEIVREALGRLGLQQPPESSLLKK